MTRSNGRTPRGTTATETHRQVKSEAEGTARDAPEPDTDQTDQTDQAGKASEAGNENGQSQDEGGSKSAASALVGMIRQHYGLGVTSNGEPYAVKPDHHVVRMLRGGRSSLRAEIAAAYYHRTGRTASQQSLTDALMAAEGMAGATNPADVHLRVAEHSDAVWVDLGDVDEHAVKLTETGWSVVSAGVPVRFRRTELTGTLPTPVIGGDLDDLWQFVNVKPGDRPLVLAWLVAALGWPGMSHPLLGVFGEQGTGKSSAARALVSLVDPSPVALRKPPRDAEQWVTAAASSWVVGVDNVSKVPEWLSDSLCRAVTGDGDVRRALYTDGGLSVFNFRRAIILNGIDLGSLRGDLAERTLALELDRITATGRVTESDLASRWKAAYPALFGALLDLVVEVRQVLPTIVLTKMPRMADYTRVLAGVDAVLGMSGVAWYSQQAEHLADDSLSSDPFVTALRTRLAKKKFEGTAATLLTRITPPRPSVLNNPYPPGWPKTGRAVTTILRRDAPALRKVGWTVEDLGNSNKGHTTRWVIAPPEKAGIPAPPRLPTPPRRKRAIRGSINNKGS